MNLIQILLALVMSLLQRSNEEIILHCTATPINMTVTVKDVDRWHKEMGWDGVGYHFLILQDGTLQIGRNLNIAGAHCKGHNKTSIGIAYVGGIDAMGNSADTRTKQQRATMRTLINVLKKIYPGIKVTTHNKYANKDCPCFKIEKL